MDYYKILIVDDEEEVRTSIIKKIPWEELGYQVIGDAENGEDALEQVRQKEPDLILTDIKMPYMDGLKLAEKVKAESESTEIVMFSGFDEFEYAKQAISLNVIEYILKPVNVEELTTILKNLKIKMDERIAQKRNIDTLRENYQAILPAIREHFLTDLIHDKLSSEEIKEGLDRFGLLSEKENDTIWAAAAIHIEMPKTEGLKQTISLHQEKELIPISVQRLIEDKLRNKFSYLSFRSTNGLGIIFAMKNQKEFTRLTGLLQQTCLDCQKILELTVTIGIGELCEGPENLGESYREAKDALGYRAFIGSGTVIYINDVEAAHNIYLEFDVQNEGELIAAIKFGDGSSEIKRVVDMLIDKMEHAKVHTSQYQIYLISIINSLMQLIQKYELDIYTVWGKDTDYLDVISHLVSAESMRNFLVNTCMAISENIHVERDNTVKNMIKEAKTYILNHYTEPELSVETVCEQLHISPAYFSTIFKRETGQSYVNYITEIRMDKAAELLSKTEEKTYIIAAQVGYAEPNYFSYVFKKRFGISPTKYRSGQ